MTRRWQLVATLLALVAVPLVFCTLLADAVPTPKLAVFLLAFGSAGVALAWRQSVARPGWLGRLQLVLCLLVTCSALYHEAERALPALLQLWGALALYLLWCEAGNVDLEMRLLTGTGLAVAAYGWVQRLGLDPVAWGIPHLSRDLTISSLGNPDYLALFLAVLAPLVWYRLVVTRASWVLGLLLWTAYMTEMILTSVRSSWIAWIVSWLLLGLLLVCGRERSAARRWLASSLAVGLAVALCLVWQARHPQTLDDLASRVHIQGKQAESVNVRFLLWQGALRVASEHPWLGCGPGNFGPAFLPYREGEPEALRLLSRMPENAHDLVLETCAESGFPAAIVLLVQFALGLVLLWRGFRDAERRTLPAALLAAWLAFAVNTLGICTDVASAVLWAWLLARADRPVGPSGTAHPGALARVSSVCLALGLAWLALASIAFQRLVWLGDDVLFQNPASMPIVQRAIVRYQEALAWAPPWDTGEGWRHLAEGYLRAWSLERGNLNWLRMSLDAGWHALRDWPDNPYLRAAQAERFVLLWSAHAGQRTREGDAAFLGAQDNWERAVAGDPFNPSFHLRYGRFLQIAGLTDRAREEVDRSLAIVPSYRDALDLKLELTRK